MYYSKNLQKHFAWPLPGYGVFGLALCLAAWAASWLRIEPFFRYSFFPLWLGYILFVDALVVARHNTSLLKRMRWGFLWLFLISSIFWWIFEVLNQAVQNWHYMLDQPYSSINYFLLASLSFSTVLPAVLGTAELLWTHKPLRPRLTASETGPRISLPLLLALEAIGVVSFLLPWLFPKYCFPLVWLCIIFLLDPLNNFFGRKSTIAHLLIKDWRFIFLPLAGLCCGFFWEMWNFLALPKWQYTVPFIGFWKIFEMPLLGYSGYLPFALELFALYQLCCFSLEKKKIFWSFDKSIEIYRLKDWKAEFILPVEHITCQSSSRPQL